LSLSAGGRLQADFVVNIVVQHYILLIIVSALTGAEKLSFFFFLRNVTHRKIVATHGLGTPVLARLEV
jgi:hypothetical protein